MSPHRACKLSTGSWKKAREYGSLESGNATTNSHLKTASRVGLRETCFPGECMWEMSMKDPGNESKRYGNAESIGFIIRALRTLIQFEHFHLFPHRIPQLGKITSSLISSQSRRK